MFSKTRPFLSLFLSLFLFSTTSFAQDMAKGKEIYETNCTACHDKKLQKDMTGPLLVGVKSRWKNDDAKIAEFVKNPPKFIETDPHVKALYAKFKTIMTPQALTDAEIKDVIAYVDAGAKPAGEETAGAAPAASEGGSGPAQVAGAAGIFGLSYGTSVLLLLGFLVLLGLIAYTLYKIGTQLRRMGVTSEPAQQADTTKKEGWWSRNWSFYWKYRNIGYAMTALSFVITVLIVIGLYNRAQDLGTQINYAPEQPIKFNHKIHAGKYKIQCQYCHTGVDRGKQANIPPVATCMNCHNYIKEGPQYGETEIAKLVKYYEQKQPIKWVRIHNLPDHVYFNHSQHVVAGKVQCSSCHGAIQEMERVRQVSTLEMGWCVNCHRETAVDTKNPYYTATYKFIEDHKKYSVGQLGGLECAKCHY